MDEIAKKATQPGTALAIDTGSLPVRVVAVGGAIAVFAAGGSILWAAFSGISALVASGAVALIGVGAFQALPLLGQIWENRILEARKAEARKHPAAQLDNRYLAKMAQFIQARDALKGIRAIVSGMQRELDEEDTVMVAEYERVKGIFLAKLEKLKKAQERLAEFKEYVERKKRWLAFSEKGKAAMEGLRGVTEDGGVEDMLADEAGNAIEQGFDEVFADLEIDTLLSDGDTGTGKTTRKKSVAALPKPAGSAVQLSTAAELDRIDVLDAEIA